MHDRRATWKWVAMVAAPVALVAVLFAVFFHEADVTPAPYLAGPQQQKIATDLYTLDEEEVAPADPQHRGGGGGQQRVDGLKLCCIALGQNAHNVREPDASLYRQAAGLCHAAVQSSADRASVLSQVRRVLKQNELPNSCR